VFAILSFNPLMYIKKLRLLTPGPTPLLPKALHAMMGSDIHHRTEDFRRLYTAVLADLKEVMDTSNDVLSLVASGTGAMEASVANLFSPGDRVIACSAGKFGERWVQIAKAFGLDAIVVEEPYGKSVSAQRVADTLKANPNVRGVFVQASETSTGAAHDVRGQTSGWEGAERESAGAARVADTARRSIGVECQTLQTICLASKRWGVVVPDSQRGALLL